MSGITNPSRALSTTWRTSAGRMRRGQVFIQRTIECGKTNSAEDSDQQARHLCYRVVDAGCGACLMNGDRIQHRGCQWCNGNRHAEAEHEEGYKEGRPIGPAGSGQREQKESDSNDKGSDDQWSPRAETVREPCAPARQQCDKGCERQEYRAGFVAE
jgi:hypothetical protein